MSSTHDALLERLHQKDPEALAGFLEANRQRLLAYVQRSLGAALRRKIEPLDVVQDVCLQALRSLPDTDFQRCDPLNWLCHLAEQRIVDAHRKFFGAQKRSAHRETPMDAGGGDQTGRWLAQLLAASMTSPSQAFSRKEKEFRLLAAMETLPEESRQAIRLRYGAGLATRDIASRLGKSDGAIRVLLTRSLKKLQELLAE